MNILLTGGAGYIGSHTAVELLEAGHRVAILDTLANSSAGAIERIRRIAGRAPAFVQADVRDRAAVGAVLRDHAIEAVIHFAGLKAVAESTRLPLAYYDCNVVGTLRLVEAMADAGVRRLVFSSSATVYDPSQPSPLAETARVASGSPYGATKLAIEVLLRDLAAAGPDWSVVVLRYFNPVGAHPSGLIGEDPAGIPNNLMPFICQVAVGRRQELSIFGGDYPTADGTGVRDYIHVVDLARGHLAALAVLGTPPEGGVRIANLGTGRGHSVLEVVETFRRVSGRPIPYRIVARRPGDTATCFADPACANRTLGWSARHDLARMCADAWRWQEANPEGYR